MKYKCFFRHSLCNCSLPYITKIESFIIKARNLDKAEKKANKQISKYKKIYGENCQLLEVSQMRKEVLK